MILIHPCLVLALALPCSARPQDAAKELQAIQKELEQESKELRKALKGLTDEGEISALYDDYQHEILPEFAERFAKLARANRGSAVAFDAWSEVMELQSQGMSGDLPREALDALVSDHLQSEGLTSVVANLRYMAPMVGEERALQALRKVSSGSPHRSVQAAALFSLGAVLGEEREANDPRLAEARTVLARLAQYDDVKSPDGRSYAKAAAGFLFALDNLVPGKPCPDFSAVDAEGAGFKLSDYKGKVVLVDFWGFW